MLKYYVILVHITFQKSAMSFLLATLFILMAKVSHTIQYRAKVDALRIYNQKYLLKPNIISIQKFPVFKHPNMQTRNKCARYSN